MKTPIISLALALLIPLAAAAEKPRALFGVVAEKNPEATQVGLVVQAVLPLWRRISRSRPVRISTLSAHLL